ncbi:hypothetical protein CEUSTIGMA_g6801.t1 [Chlamydomonas eustigma]|uniref:Mitochondrial fission process protein 1 n=1 Tax=Chlamydomonas eustigma TaxID=1157962 RepID=A0A250X8W3_9CHLO|nr:hypothetical protein CEUSTIGMA_g6801.t1 [Chlamydomonas eustigma]|eukprot:GAX79359.1 hypothetical protein CEUSTIGMA_g6801.t1 [Chlamydomonas eustigma]
MTPLSVQPSKLSPEERRVLMKYFDNNGDGKLSGPELMELMRQAKEEMSTSASKLPENVTKIIKKFDLNGNGVVEENESQALGHELELGETNARYAAYTAAFARGFRYLAFTSDFGEALRPVIASRLVTASYAVSIGYCFADVGWEAYKHHQRGYMTEPTHHKPFSQPMSMTQLVVERSTFQALASVAVPFAIIHTTVDATKHLIKAAGASKGALGRWGPSIAGLAIIPALPMCLDEVVEGGVESMFERYGPWAASKHMDQQHVKAE